MAEVLRQDREGEHSCSIPASPLLWTPLPHNLWVTQHNGLGTQMKLTA